MTRTDPAAVPVDPRRLADFFPRLAAVAACGAVTIGTLALLGWVLDLPILKTGIWKVSVKTNAALGLILCGSSLLLLRPLRRSRGREWAGRACALVAIGIGVLTGFEHMTGYDLGIDQLWFREEPSAFATFSPNRMGMPGSTCLPLLGAALLLLDYRTRRGRRPAQYLAMLVAMVAALPTVGYLYGAEEFYLHSKWTGIAFHTAISLCLLAIGILFARVDGVLTLLCAQDEGGWIARRVLPLAIFVPLGAGWLGAEAERHENLDTASALGMMYLISSAILMALIWWIASRTSKHSQARALAELARADLGERLVAVVENMRQGLLALNDFGTIELVNREMERLLGRTRAEVVGKPLGEVLSPEEWMSLRAACGRAAEQAAGVAHEHQDARTGAWLQSDIVPQRHGLTIFSRDVTEERRSNAERQQLLASERVARAEAEHSNRIKDEFLATLSHELRTPLNAILGWTQVLLKRTAADSDVRDGLTTIERNARSQSRLIDDLLDMSRIISGKLRLDIQSIDLAAVIDAAVQAVRPGADAKGIVLETRIEPRAKTIAGDHARLQQVVWNLLSNAVKFTPKDGRVQVSLSRAPAHIEIRVTDTGSGIAPEFLPFVFDRFRQADASTTRRQTGLGLGLSIVRHLTELHGGSVSAESEGAGKGATFTVRLPVTASARPVGARAPAGEGDSHRQASGPAPSEISLRGLRVLIVEDQDDARALVQRLLEEAGAEVVAASEGRGALELVKRLAPNVMVSDIAMPEFDGYELIRSLRALPKEQGGATPAVALTALARKEDVQHALQAGFQVHISKPVHGPDLIAAIARLARGSAEQERGDAASAPQPARTNDGER